MLTPGGTHLAVWGDPIEHSLSPRLHAAAYAVLELDWSYGRRRVDAEGFDDAIAQLGPEWRGLSCTMPLKEKAFALASARDRRAELTRSVNTLLLSGDGGPRGFNTDVGGMVRVLAEQKVPEADSARIIGTGATAASAVIALRERGTRRIAILARRPDRARGLIALGESLGMVVTAAGLDERSFAADVTVATLPGGTSFEAAAADALAEDGGVLLDAAYAPWPSDLAAAWLRRGATPISGLGMLLYQALLQVRIFVTGETETELPDETLVLAEMRAALMGD